jgi:hypothetical protein
MSARLRGVPLELERWGSGGMYLRMWPFLLAPVGLLVHVVSWRQWCRFHSFDEVLGPLVSGDIEVRLLK